MLAYRDIDAAFDAFLAMRGSDRPFLLVGHSRELYWEVFS
ncbi:hypothetical protein JCM17846_28340 [Iodidimonas nitroreducens]|uniref:Uncharacterized protein n=1 Tax=Iodidimonas nitroreducens TaxID=1236968 RepID=A0A5A7NAA2_9PROT|nr:hypothetical protein JCM17846_28340 [Iodidimonas nitroreducens]